MSGPLQRLSSVSTGLVSAPPGVSDDLTGAAAQQPRVLFIDDDAICRRHFEVLLGSRGITVDVAASADEAITALVRLGWMAYDGNGEVDTALTLIDSALDIDPASQAALYMKGTILWCGAGDNDAAAAIFTELLDDPDLDDSSRPQIESDLDQASTGEGCE